MTPQPQRYGPVFGVPAELPRGPHRLTREQVASSQRARLMAGIAEAVADRGYAATTIDDITGRAGVSPRTFYEHFNDKLDCFVAAYDAMIAVLYERIGAELSEDADWHDFVVSSLSAYLGTLDENPAASRAFVVEVDGAGPDARQRRREAYQRFADLLEARHGEIRRRDRTLGPLPNHVFLGLVHGVRVLARDALEERPRTPLLEMVPDILFWITATIRGASAAADELAEWQSARVSSS